MAITYKKCIDCGSRNVRKIVYGYPSREMMVEESLGKIKLGGCCLVIGVSPEYYCNDCNREWSRTDSIDASYNQIVAIHVTINRFPQGEVELSVNFDTGMLTWKYTYLDEMNEKQLDNKALEQFMFDLKLTRILQWRRSYFDPHILDGTSWKIDIVREKRTLKRSGRNKFPAEWEVFCNLIYNLTGDQFFLND